MKLRNTAALAATLFVVGVGAPALAQDSTTTTTVPATTVEHEDDGPDLGWIGLLGLAGLLGLRRKPHVTHDTTTARPR